MPYVREHLELYKAIRRLHKHLPPALRFMGNKYVRDEWVRHRTLLSVAGATPEALKLVETDPTAPKVRSNFISEWSNYHAMIRDQIERASRWEGGAAPKYGARLDPTKLNLMTDEQIGQLHSLKKEVFKEPGEKK
ncbi:hypothetical protein BC830DRAFT_1090303 [Chytriomyces sp. MP71]|nr:hypothetical protein BC830DRAFT_1090303 [Chytriomyces sp. MP71]